MTQYHFKPGAWARLPTALKQRYWKETDYARNPPSDKLRYELDVSSEEHYSHNVSDSFWRCYGCGIEAGDKRLYEPCPSPDHVGQMSIRHHEEKRRQLGIT